MSTSSVIASGQKMVNLPLLGEVNLMYLLIGGAVLILGFVLWKTMQSPAVVENNGPSEEELNRMRHLQELELQTQLQQQQLQEMQIKQQEQESANESSGDPEANVGMNHGASLDEAFKGSKTF